MCPELGVRTTANTGTRTTTGANSRNPTSSREIRSPFSHSLLHLNSSGQCSSNGLIQWMFEKAISINDLVNVKPVTCATRVMSYLLFELLNNLRVLADVEINAYHIALQI